MRGSVMHRMGSNDLSSFRHTGTVDQVEAVHLKTTIQLQIATTRTFSSLQVGTLQFDFELGWRRRLASGEWMLKVYMGMFHVFARE